MPMRENRILEAVAYWECSHDRASYDHYPPSHVLTVLIQSSATSRFICKSNFSPSMSTLFMIGKSHKPTISEASSTLFFPLFSVDSQFLLLPFIIPLFCHSADPLQHVCGNNRSEALCIILEKSNLLWKWSLKEVSNVKNMENRKLPNFDK